MRDPDTVRRLLRQHALEALDRDHGCHSDPNGRVLAFVSGRWQDATAELDQALEIAVDQVLATVDAAVGVTYFRSCARGIPRTRPIRV